MNLEIFKKIFAQEFDKFQQERNQDKESLEKFADDVPHDEQLVPTFEEDPIGFILYSYPTLKETLEVLLNKDFFRPLDSKKEITMPENVKNLPYWEVGADGQHPGTCWNEEVANEFFKLFIKSYQNN
jgi:hypothetical protein